MAAVAPIALGSLVGGSIFSTASQVMALDAGSKAASEEARSVEQQAFFNEQQAARTLRFQQATANAVGAASGVDISSGTPAQLELDRAKQAAIETLNIRRTGQVAAQGLRYQSRLLRRQIAPTIIGGVFNTGSLLGSYAAKGGNLNSFKGSGFGAEASGAR